MIRAQDHVYAGLGMEPGTPSEACFYKEGRCFWRGWCVIIYFTSTRELATNYIPLSSFHSHLKFDCCLNLFTTFSQIHSLTSSFVKFSRLFLFHGLKSKILLFSISPFSKNPSCLHSTYLCLRWEDFKYYTCNSHPLFVICFEDKLHPYSRTQVHYCWPRFFFFVCTCQSSTRAQVSCYILYVNAL
jgi:hypothetical protein